MISRNCFSLFSKTSSNKSKWNFNHISYFISAVTKIREKKNDIFKKIELIWFDLISRIEENKRENDSKRIDKRLRKKNRKKLIKKVNRRQNETNKIKATKNKKKFFFLLLFFSSLSSIENAQNEHSRSKGFPLPNCCTLSMQKARHDPTEATCYKLSHPTTRFFTTAHCLYVRVYILYTNTQHGIQSKCICMSSRSRAHIILLSRSRSHSIQMYFSTSWLALLWDYVMTYTHTVTHTHLVAEANELRFPLHFSCCARVCQFSFLFS